MRGAMVSLAASSIIQLRAALGVSQAELAKLAGISRHTVMRIENDRTVPSPLVQAALARVAEDYLNSAQEAVSVPMQLRRLRSMDPRGSSFKKTADAKGNVAVASRKHRVQALKPTPAVGHSTSRRVS